MKYKTNNVKAKAANCIATSFSFATHFKLYNNDGNNGVGGNSKQAPTITTM